MVREMAAKDGKERVLLYGGIEPQHFVLQGGNRSLSTQDLGARYPFFFLGIDKIVQRFRLELPIRAMGGAFDDSLKWRNQDSADST